MSPFEGMSMENAPEEAGNGLENREDAEALKQELFERAGSTIEDRHSGEAYHNPEHPEGVLARGKRILDLAEASGITIDEETRLAQEVAAKVHDIKVYYFINAAGQRARLRGFEDRGFQASTKEEDRVKIIPGSESGNEVKVATQAQYEAYREVDESLPGWDELPDITGNEEASWLEAEALMSELDPEGVVFTERVRSLVKAAIAATYPENPAGSPFAEIAPEHTHFHGHTPETSEEEDIEDVLKFPANKPVGLRFDQPLLTDKSELAIVAVAMGDLSSGGANSFEQFREEGDGEFREIQEVMRHELEEKSLEELTAERKAEIAKAAINWVHTQPGFLIEQFERFKNILDNNIHIKDSPTFKEALEAEYGKFEDNILAASHRYLAYNKDYLHLTKAENYPEGDEKLHELLSNMGFMLAGASEHEDLVAA